LLHLPNDFLQSPSEVVLRWTAVAVTACPGWGLRRRIQIDPCLAGIGGWLSATDRAVTNPRSAERSWWSVGGLLRAVGRVGAGFGLELDAGVSFPLATRRFVTMTPDRTVGETVTASVLATLGVIYEL
jgi:hypothetical protein